LRELKRKRNLRARASRPATAASTCILALARENTEMTSVVARVLEDLRERGGLKGTDVANVAGVSPATVSRWSNGRAAPHPRTQRLISDLRYVVDRLSEIYTAEETREWLYARNQLLDGARAIDLIHDDRTEDVLAVIERLDAGAYL
jgi:transcriptional regulator with XRE-family HTH domain